MTFEELMNKAEASRLHSEKIWQEIESINQISENEDQKLLERIANIKKKSEDRLVQQTRSKEKSTPLSKIEVLQLLRERIRELQKQEEKILGSLFTNTNR